MEELYQFLKEKEPDITTALTKRRIACSFIPPRAPHFGGLREAAVKVMKKHLYTQRKLLTFEGYSILLANIKAIFNSRPLTSLTNNPNNLDILTLAHFFNRRFAYSAH